jgi:acetyltransferase-like isoleucine patch superfamily enzyme
LRKVICDKDTRIGNECAVGGFGDDMPSHEFEDLLNSGITLLGRNTSIAERTEIGANTVVYSGVRVTEKHVDPGSTLR